MRSRRIPIRTCIGCRQERPKREMTRVVRSADGSVAVDPTGKRSGRGTYICPNATCWRNALRRGSLGRALKAEISEADRAALEQAATEFDVRETPASANS
ncbi:MAG: DUF448 domain-containing protein [Chloroflexi bacterium]|nr:DUF448 domain-containing protein [Chloroflexota bacterium]